MTAFVDSCVQTVAGSAVAAERRSRGQPRARRLLRALADKRRILVTTHVHADPDALGSVVALAHLLTRRLAIPAGQAGEEVTVTLSVKGRIGGGVNQTFLQIAHGKLTPWDEIDPSAFDAIVLLDTQPQFSFSPLPPGVLPTAVIDHHRGGGRRPKVPCWDVRPEVGATCSIVFRYFMEVEEPIPPELAAGMLYAIESDLAGAAGAPGELDNLAMASLTVTADSGKLYQMRFTPLPRTYYRAYAVALANAEFQDSAVVSHLDAIESMEQPAVMADFLLRFDQAEWVLVTAKVTDKLLLSIRTRSKDRSAADVIRVVLSRLGEGGGHRAKAGGHVRLGGHPGIDLEKVRRKVWRRFLCAVGLKPGKATKLVG